MVNLPELDLAKNWVEYFAILLALLGFLIAVLSYPSPFLTYSIFFICGMLGGKLWWRTRHNLRFSWAIVLIGFIIGYLLGSPRGKWWIMLIIFFAGMASVYYLHDKKIIKSFSY